MRLPLLDISQRTKAALLLLGIFAHASANSQPIDLKGTVFEQVGKEANLNPVLLYAIALCESAYSQTPKDGLVAPYPWVLRSGKTPFYGTGFKDTEIELARLLRSSNAIDVGMMQINIKWNGHRVSQPSDLLDPLTNVRVGAQILNELLSQYPENAIKAIGFYHSKNPGKAAGYGRTVWRVFLKLVQK